MSNTPLTVEPSDRGSNPSALRNSEYSHLAAPPTPGYRSSIDSAVEVRSYHDELESPKNEGPREGGDLEDLEAQIPPRGPELVDVGNTTAAEYGVSMHAKLVALSFYFFLSLGLTLQSKMLLGKFAFPYLLTASHASMTAFGCYVLMLRGYIKPTRLGRRENLVLLAFSSLFTINIAISNVSLALVSVAFHQVVRSTVPVVTILIYRLYYSRSYSTATYVSLIPIIFGVGLVTYGDYYCTTLGLSLTLLGVFLAAVKTVVSNRLMTGSLSLPPLEILLRMCPLAAVQSLLYAHFTGESARFMTYVSEGHLTNFQISALLSNSMIAFLLNISSFQTNKIAGALTMTVCGNVKQVLTVLLGIALFDVKVGAWNGVGMLIALGGAAYYSKVELSKKRAALSANSPPQPDRKEVPLMSRS